MFAHVKACAATCESRPKCSTLGLRNQSSFMNVTILLVRNVGWNEALPHVGFQTNAARKFVLAEFSFQPLFLSIRLVEALHWNLSHPQDLVSADAVTRKQCVVQHISIIPLQHTHTRQLPMQFYTVRQSFNAVNFQLNILCTELQLNFQI